MSEAPLPTAVPTPTTPPEPLAAMVNGTPILLADYERRVKQYQQSLLEQGLDPATEEGQARLAQVRQEVLGSLIDHVLIEQGASGLGVTVGEDEVDAQVAADVQAGGGQAAFEEWLKATGQSREDYEKMLRESMLTQRVMAAVTAELPDVADQVHARHIVVESQDAANQVLVQLQSGADFSTIAREWSVDLSTKDNGGDLGWFPRGLVAPELEAIAFSLQPGEISNPVQFGEGYHFVQVVERQPARAVSPETKVHLALAVFRTWLEQQRIAAAIERFVTE